MLIPAQAQDAPTTPAKTIAVRLGDGTAELAEDLRSGLWFLEHRQEWRLEIGAEAAGEVVVELEYLPVREGSDLPRRLRGLPVELHDGGFVFAGTRYDAARYALALRLPRAAPTSWVVLARDPDTLTRLAVGTVAGAAGFNRRRPPADYVVWEHSQSQRRGLWRPDGDTVRPDPGERNDPAEREAAYAALASIRRPRVVVRVPSAQAAEPRWRELADTLDAAAWEMAPRVPSTLTEPVEVIVEDDLVAFGRHLGELDEALVDADGRLHLAGQTDDLFAWRYGLARALVRRAGLTLRPWLEDGAALSLSGSWYGRPYAGWLPEIVAGDVLPTAGELLAGVRPPDGSEVLWPAVAAAVVERLDGGTLARKLDPEPSQATVAGVLERLAADARAGLEPAAPAGGRRAARSFHRGVSLAMDGGDAAGGYHAPAIDDKLAYLRRMGADSVSIMPLAMKRHLDRPDLRFAIRNPGDETDAGLVHAARRAHALGFTVLWKPQIYVGGGWPGEIEMTSPADWDAWWRVYRRFVLHHAVLAEWSGCELFAVGVELGKTLPHEAEWRRLIGSVRRIFRGELTYAGNWWGDWERAPFWDALDVVGVDAYFPLAASADAGRDELLAGAREVVAELAAAAARHGKPVALTEVGFAARRGAWVAPHEEGGTFSLDDQRLAYEVFFEALGHPPWLHGAYLWKTFSSPGTHETVERPNFGFTGRPAEQVVRAWFRGTGSAE